MRAKCGKCGHDDFASVEVRPLHGYHHYEFIQCLKCGTPAGVVQDAQILSDMRKLSIDIDSLRQTVLDQLGDIHRLLKIVDEEQKLLLEKVREIKGKR
jgi:hypothetical protein